MERNNSEVRIPINQHWYMIEHFSKATITSTPSMFKISRSLKWSDLRDSATEEAVLTVIRSLHSLKLTKQPTPLIAYYGHSK